MFCAQDGVTQQDATDVEAALEQLRGTSDEVTFVGGEPTLQGTDLDVVVARARARGFSAIGVQTNGVALAEPGRVTALVNAGLTDAHLSIHGANAAVHDYHTGHPGSFAAVRRTAAALREHDIEIVATTVLTRSTFRVLAELVPLLSQLEIAAWTVSVPVTAGRAADAFDRIHPRLGLAIPFALHAIDRARKLGIPAVVAGAPSCVLGPHAGRVLPTPPRAYADVCAACEARASCPGVDAAYLERFTAEELRPRDDTPRADGLPDRLARMFVGIGERALRAPTSHPAPAQVRHALPVLGKPSPATAEVRGRARRSGEALRELFPGLFEDGDDA